MSQSSRPTLQIAPLGDRAFLIHFDSEPAAAAWASTVRALRITAITDVALAYRSVAIHFDPELIDPPALESQLADLSVEPHSAPAGRLIVIPVLYDGPDLSTVAALLQVNASAVITEHTRPEYHVFAIGFLPGFPYAGYLAPSLSGLPRKSVPLARVPPGSVAIAGVQTGIYPTESPGGWHLLGRTPFRIADPETAYFPIRAGDRLRFDPISPHQFESLRDERI